MGGDLGPYDLKNKQGQLLENVLQFSKCYQTAPNVNMEYSRGNKKIVWN